MAFNEQAALDMIYLCGCAIAEELPEESRIKTMDFEAVYSISKFHSVQVCAYEALKKSEEYKNRCSEELQKKWKLDADQAVYRDIMFDMERETILAQLEEKGIWYMPLKGVLLKNYYPTPGMRFMADNDILFDPEYQKEVRGIMLGMGYKAESYNSGHEDMYIKAPFFNFEMHLMLFDYVFGDTMPEYYNDVKETLIKDSGNKFGYHFSDENFYIYFLAHGYKHYEEAGGNGIRFLMDCYLYLKKHGSNFDWKYVNDELDKLQINDFAKMCKELSFLLFDNPYNFTIDSLVTEKKESLLYVLKSGTFGIEEHLIKNRYKRQEAQSKLKYLFRRIVPEKELIKTYYPFVYRHKWIIPFFLIYRFFRGIILKSGKIINELKTLKKV